MEMEHAWGLAEAKYTMNRAKSAKSVSYLREITRRNDGTGGRISERGLKRRYEAGIEIPRQQVESCAGTGETN